MFNADTYNFEVQPGTRNHKGYFVQETAYKLVGIDQAGWALICIDNSTCHYVDPDNLHEVSGQAVM